MTQHGAHLYPTDYPTRAAVYRKQAAAFHKAGDREGARSCEEFARRCDALAETHPADTR